MSLHNVVIKWVRESDSFAFKEYNRNHVWDFEHGNVVNASAAVDYMGDKARVDPEQAFVASIASCHMLTFLALASQQKLIINHYEDHAVGELGKNAQGKMAITSVTLSPKVQFSDQNQPDAALVQQLHHKAHEYCFIANSVNCEIKVDI